MAVATWVGGDGTGSQQTDYGRAANWSGGVVPDSDDHVIVANTGHNCKLDANREAASLTVNSGATLDGSGAKISIKSEGDSSEGTNGYAVNIDGIIAGNFDLEIDTPDTTNLDIIPSSGNIRNLIIDLGDGARVAKIQTGGPTLTGDLTITSGQLSTENNALTVQGTTTIGPASGAADQATLTCGSGTISLGASETSSYALRVAQGGTFTGGTGAHTIGSLEMVNNAAAKCTLTSGDTTISSERTSADNHLVIGSSTTFAHGSGTIITTFAGTTHMDVDKTLNNLTINHASAVHKLSDSLDLAGNLTITAGEFNPNGRNLTVAGDVSVTGTLTGSSGAMSFGSLTIASGGTYSATSGTTTIKGNASSSSNLAWANSGTFTHNSGTVLFDGTNTFGGSTFGHINPATNTFNNLTINADSKVLQLRGNSTTLTVAGDLTMTDGTLMNYGTDTVTTTVTGDVSIANGATIGANTGGNDMTAPLNFGSLSVASGGTFIATSDTTTITKNNGGTDGRAFFIHGSATFNHNNGLVKFTASSPQVAPMSTGQTATSHPFYDLEQTSGTMQWKAEHHRVLNNCTMKGSAFNGSTGNVHVLGICRLTGETFNSGDTATNDNNFFQTLIVESGATLDLSAINITVGSLRNLGGTIQ